MSKHRTSAQHVGKIEFHFNIDLIEQTSPHGTVKLVRVRYAHNNILHSITPLAHLPADIQEMFD